MTVIRQRQGCEQAILTVASTYSYLLSLEHWRTIVGDSRLKNFIAIPLHSQYNVAVQSQSDFPAFKLYVQMIRKDIQRMSSFVS